eukprot:TRINITY_DN3221_c0_g1_i8.p1 TRINITY_DN3221_c0_g1~~TRINITY_DN3221_c0_g1_i8.p1  ORF type:complete len:578 (+),score=98.73 TRINITY_DN3221_c0_g1_i8:86-1735(+)
MEAADLMNPRSAHVAAHAAQRPHLSMSGQCSICLSAFPFDDPVTAFAKCAHVACRTCLREYLEGGDDRCPWCRLPLTITADDVALLPDQPAVLPLDENVTAQALPGQQPKQVVLCRDDDSPATHFCPVCSVPLCGDCAIHHQRPRSATRDHQLEPMQDGEVGVSGLGLAHGRVPGDRCAIHNGQTLVMCCVQCKPSCVVCSECMLSPKHAGHSFKPLATQLPQLKQQLLQLVHDIEAQSDTVKRDLNACRKQAADLVDGINKQVAAKQAEIKMLVDYMHKELKPLEAKIVSLEVMQLTIERVPPEVKRKLKQSDSFDSKQRGPQTEANMLLLSALQSQPLLEHVLAISKATASASALSVAAPTKTMATTTQAVATTTQLQWAAIEPSSLLHIDKSVITHTGTEDKHAAVVDQRKWTQGVHSFTVHLLAGSPQVFGGPFAGVDLGVTCNPQLPTRRVYVGGTADSWSYLPCGNSAWHNNQRTEVKTVKYSAGGARVNDKITITVDMDKHTMSVTVNGQDGGVVHSNLPTTVYPAISLCYPKQQVKVTFAD